MIKIEMPSFYLAKYPVTNLEYEQFDPAHKEKRNEYSDQDDQPAIYVSWEDANNYCKWLSKKTGKKYRLPTEAEWEFAASGGGKREYPWGNEKPTPERANYDPNLGKTAPIGSYPLGMTPEGLFDMAGNVWEWCADWYDKNPKNGHVVRGGSWFLTVFNLLCSYRLWNYPVYRYSYVGFRVACGA